MRNVLVCDGNRQRPDDYPYQVVGLPPLRRGDRLTLTPALVAGLGMGWTDPENAAEFLAGVYTQPGSNKSLFHVEDDGGSPDEATVTSPPPEQAADTTGGQS